MGGRSRIWGPCLHRQVEHIREKMGKVMMADALRRLGGQRQDIGLLEIPVAAGVRVRP